MARRPNVVVCMCDQLRAFETGCYGHPVVRTPNIDRLAREGARFETAVSNNPVCMPARSCLLSGQYSRTCMGMLGNLVERGPDGRETMPEYPVERRAHLPGRTLAEVLRGEGYETALIGKWHIHPSPGTVGFDYWLYPRVHHRHTGQSFMETGRPEREAEGFSADFESARLREYLQQRGERPFLLFYSISPPHMPLADAPERYLRMYSPNEAVLRANVPADGARDEEWFRIYLWDFLYYERRLPHTERLPEGFGLRALTALYYGMTTWVDDKVGEMMSALRAAGAAEDTVVVFTSDHGDNLGSHGRYNKGLLIEESIRVPMIFHAPGRVTPGVRTGQVAQLIDVMPTLLDMCGAAVPHEAQGRRLTPILRGERDRLDESDAVIECGSGYLGLRTPRWLYGMRTADGGRTITEERYALYDLAADPWEMRNLVGERACAEGAEACRRRLMQWHCATPWMRTDDAGNALPGVSA